MAKQELAVSEVPVATEGLEEELARGVAEAPTAKEVQMELEGPKVPEGPSARKVLPAKSALEVRLALLVSKGRKETRDLKDHKEKEDQLVSWDLKERKARLGPKVLKDLAAHRVLEVNLRVLLPASFSLRGRTGLCKDRTKTHETCPWRSRHCVRRERPIRVSSFIGRRRLSLHQRHVAWRLIRRSRRPDGRQGL